MCGETFLEWQIMFRFAEWVFSTSWQDRLLRSVNLGPYPTIRIGAVTLIGAAGQLVEELKSNAEPVRCL